jgi:hypothetical protein
MYHSTAILLPDSSILISGSNPNKDFTDAQWRSRTDVEKWFPWYYNEIRPTFSNPPTNLSYGGEGFDVSLGSLVDETSVQTAKVVLVRGGFNTHAIGFGQRHLELSSTYTIDMNTNLTTLHVSQLPGSPGPTLFQPGPAMIFLLINGVPSEGEMVMIGNGQIGTQPTTVNALLPNSEIKAVTNTSTSNTSTQSGGSGSGGASASTPVSSGGAGTSVPLSGRGMVLGVVSVVCGVVGSMMVFL